MTVPGPGAAARTTIQLRGWVTVTGRVIARVRDRNGDLHDNPVFAPVELQSARFEDGTHNPDPEAGPLYKDGPSVYSTVNTDPMTGEFHFENVRGGSIRLVTRNPFYGDETRDLGFVLEGIRIAMTGYPPGSGYAFVGDAIGEDGHVEIRIGSGLVGDDEAIAFNGIPGLEDTVAPGDERRQGIDTQAVGDMGKKMFQRRVIGDFKLFEIHGSFFSIRTEPGMSAKPIRR